MSRNHWLLSVGSKVRSVFPSGGGRYQRRRRSLARRAAWHRVELLEDRTLLASVWIAQGPSPAQGGQVENVSPNNEVVGAIHTVAAHPTNADILYFGGVNGGVWKTTNATAASPTWTPLTDDLPSMSIGALQFDPTDGTNQTLVAGVGRYSSFFREGGSRSGLLRTTDGGSNWTVLDGSGTLVGRNISGVAPRGNTITASVNVDDSFACANIGVFHSTDGGATFAQPLTGVSYDLASHPGNTNVLYSSLVFGDVCGGAGQPNGVYRSANGGANWSKVSDPTLDALIIDNATSNLEISVGSSGQVYAAIINTGNLAGMFRSPNGNLGTWVQMDSPKTNENGTDVGLNPRGSKGPPAGSPMEEIAGGQGAIHFSIRADPNNSNIVYVGGDRQPRSFGDTGGFPNSIGALDFSGRLFRCDAAQPANSQCVHLTHSNTLGAAGGGTASSSAPHADSREMVFDFAGNIIEVDDGGIYRRTNPQNNTGDWFSINGNLQVTEAHDVAYDPISDILFSGNQDTGSTEQNNTGSPTWRSVQVADGGDVAVDSITLAGSNQSIRYHSIQNLGFFERRVVDNNNTVISNAFPALTVTGGGPEFDPQFDTPIALNAVDPQRIIFGGDNGLYESTNQGDTITQVAAGVLTPSSTSNPIASGGRSGGVDNLHVVYAGDRDGNVHVRTASGGAFTPTNPDVSSFDLIRDVRMDPDQWQTAFAIDFDQVFTTTTTGASWTDITGDLPAGTVLRSLEYLVGTPDVVAVGTNLGVFVSQVTSLGTWVQLGTGMPNVPVWDMKYDATDDVLAVGTLGRGVWTLPSPTSDDNNDDFADRIDLGSGFVLSTTGNNAGYTGEPGEPSPTTTTQSAWWAWTAPGNGTLSVDTFGSDFDTFLAVYTGVAVDSLTLTPNGSNDDSGGTLQSAVSITVSAGTEYEIAVDGFSSNTGNITLNLDFEIDTNDDFANRIDLGSGIATSTTGNNVGFTGEPGEPSPTTTTQSAWWAWTAPGNGTLSVDTFGSDFDTFLAVYTGVAVDSLTLTPNGSNDDSGGTLQSAVSITVSAGTEYEIAVDGFSDNTGNITLSLDFEIDTNDDFANRIDLGSVVATSTTGNNVGFTGEPGEPSPTTTTQSAWWAWTAPGTGTLSVDTFGSDFDTFLAVYTGAAVDSLTLTPNGSNDDSGGTLQSAVTITVSAGTEYEIAVDGFSDDTGNITLNLVFDTNDDFANRIDLGSGIVTSTTGDNVGFTGETGEPSPTTTTQSAWWAWTAPGNGALLVDTFGSNFDTFLSVYTGVAVDSLTLTPNGSNDDSGGTLQSEVIIAVSGGTEYEIAVDGFSDNTGDITLNLRFGLPGDANLDGFVDVSDFNIWNANKFTSGTSWNTGDFNGDGVTDVADFNVWNSNKFTGVVDLALASEDTDDLLPGRTSLPMSLDSPPQQSLAVKALLAPRDALTGRMDTRASLSVPATFEADDIVKSLRPAAEVSGRSADARYDLRDLDRVFSSMDAQDRVNQLGDPLGDQLESTVWIN